MVAHLRPAGGTLTVVLGINAYHSSASAAVIVDGELLAAVEEERFTRQKYETGFPHRSVRYCLEAAGLGAGDVDQVAMAGNPLANLWPKLRFAAGTSAGRSLVVRRGEPMAQMRIGAALRSTLGPALRAKLHRVEHHVAHMASAFLVSPFERAAVASFDGFGDMVSSMWGIGEGSRLRILGRVSYPHSLGMFYTGITQYLGFHSYGEEYKVMGLASYGEPEQIDAMRAILRHRGGLTFELDMACFRHLREIRPMVWNGGTARLGPIWDEGLVRRLGPRRTGPDDPIQDRHRNIASSMQARLEEVELSMLGSLRRETGLDALCLAGGVALNCVVNGRIRDEAGFRDVFVQPAAHDGGTSLGAAAYVYHHVLGNPRRYVMDHAYLGPEFGEAACRAALDAAGLPHRRLDDRDLVELCAAALEDGAVLGWFQGRSEFGPRALGNRSILADPRRPEMKDVLNARVKHREPFRPFAPVVLEDRVGQWFTQDYPSPFMLLTYPVRPEQRARIPAPTHVDGTGRVQTIRQSQHPRYHDLVEAFGRRTGVPVLLNTSFNENEPICNTPEEAVDCFVRTRMDLLVLGSLVVDRRGADGGPGPGA